MIYEKEQITVAEVSKEWIMTKKGFVKDSTCAHYTNIINNHIIPEIGNHKIRQLNNDIVDDFLKKQFLEGRKDGHGGLSSKTVSDIRAVLISILKYANKKTTYQRWI